MDNKYIYAIFTDSNGTKFSKPISAVINLDRTIPLVNAGADVVLNTGFTRTANVTEANIKSMLWEMKSGSTSGSFSFSSPTTATTSIYPNSIDGDYTIQFTVRDKAGNRVSDDMDYTVDRVAPGSPSITTISQTTVSTTLRWDWNPGSGTFSNYERKLNTGAWTDTDLTYYTLSLFKTAGNVSAYDIHSISYFPSTSAYLSPANGSTGVSRYTNLDWPDFSGATGYLIYARMSGDSYGSPVTVSTSYLNAPTLLASTTYNWYYKPYGRRTTDILGTSPEYSFTTGK
jgi:hypothetical protein